MGFEFGHAKDVSNVSIPFGSGSLLPVFTPQRRSETASRSEEASALLLQRGLRLCPLGLPLVNTYFLDYHHVGRIFQELRS